MKKYQELVFDYIQVAQFDVLTISGDNNADGLIRFEDIPGQL